MFPLEIRDWGNAKLLESMAKECCFEVKLIDKVKLDDCEITPH